MTKNQNYHLNDRTAKYLSGIETKRLHEYLNIPGVFKVRLPQEMVFPNLDNKCCDEKYKTKDGMIVHLEEESEDITPTSKEKFMRYVSYTSWYNSDNIFFGVICHKNPKKESELYEHSPSLMLKIHYFYFPPEELWEKYENVINKVKQNKILSDEETLDIAFLSKFMPKKDAPKVVEILANIYPHAIIQDKLLKLDIGVILGGMIRKHITNKQKQKRLMEMIKMKDMESELEKLVYDEFGDTLIKKDKEIEQAHEKIAKYKNIANQLNNVKEKSPEIAKLINTLMLI